MAQLKDVVGKKLVWAGKDPANDLVCFLFENDIGFSVEPDALMLLPDAREVCRKIMEESREAVDLAMLLRLSLTGDGAMEETMARLLEAGVLNDAERATLMKAWEEVKNGRKIKEAGEPTQAPSDNQQTQG